MCPMGIENPGLIKLALLRPKCVATLRSCFLFIWYNQKLKLVRFRRSVDMKKRFFTAVMAAFVIGNVLVGCSAEKEYAGININEPESEATSSEQVSEEKDENSSNVLISQDSYLDIKPQYTLITCMSWMKTAIR